MVEPTVPVVDTDPAAREGTIETVEATLPDAAVREAESMATAEAVLDGVDASDTGTRRPTRTHRSDRCRTLGV